MIGSVAAIVADAESLLGNQHRAIEGHEKRAVGLGASGTDADDPLCWPGFRFALVQDFRFGVNLPSECPDIISEPRSFANRFVCDARTGLRRGTPSLRLSAPSQAARHACSLGPCPVFFSPA